MTGQHPPSVATLAASYQRPRSGVLLVLAYLLAILSPLLLAAAAVPRVNEPYLTVLGKNFGLLGFAILALQFVLASRWPAICRPFGLDMVLRFHKGMAIYALLLLLCHPLLLAAGSKQWRLIYGLSLPWPVWLGKITLLLLIVQGVASLWQRKILRFERWRLLHNQAVFILGLAALHSSLLGDDLERLPLQLLWLLLVGAAAGFYLDHKVYQPIRTGKRLYQVTEVIQETHDVRTLVLAPPAGESLPAYLPGQFHFLTFYRGDQRYDGEEHHFTISSSPTRPGVLTSTIKASGDFTATLGETPKGSRVRVEGPFGRFSHLLQADGRDLVFIAGGIGITPCMSMLRYLRDTESARRVLLLYANRTEADIVFREELAEMASRSRPRLKAVHILSRPGQNWSGEDGHLDREMIRRHGGIDLRGKIYYLCCPPAMMSAVSRMLRDLGVDSSRVHGKRFWL